MAESSSSFVGAWQLVQYLFLFGLVLGLAYFSTRGLRRLAPFARGKHLRLIDQLHLGTNRSFYLLAVADRVVLVAMGEGGVSTVATLDDPALVEGLLAEAAPSPLAAPNLAGLLRATQGPAARLGEALRSLRPGSSMRTGVPRRADSPLPAFEEILQTAAGQQRAEAGQPSWAPASQAEALLPQAARPEETELRRRVARLKKLVEKTEV